jgi:1-acyl-sn-glycerol-3-phosphate acyltransferase
MMGYLIYSLPTLNKMKKLNKKMDAVQRDHIVHQVPKKWAKTMMRLTGASILIEGTNNIPEGPVVIISNHEGNFDIPVLLGSIEKPFGFISKKEVKKIPIVSQWMDVINCVFIDRSDRNKGMKAIRDGVKILKKGHSLVIFPEGTRSKGGPVKRFKSGSFRLAIDAQVPIIPISIMGTAELFEKNNRLIKPAEIRVVIGKPIVSHMYSDRDVKELASEVRELIINQMENKKIAS